MVKGLKFLKDELSIIHRGNISGARELLVTAAILLTGRYRRETYECPGESKRSSETVRFWSLWTTGQVACQDQYWMPKLHGCKLTGREYMERIICD